jgi:hypothetical protein
MRDVPGRVQLLHSWSPLHPQKLANARFIFTNTMKHTTRMKLFTNARDFYGKTDGVFWVGDGVGERSRPTQVKDGQEFCFTCFIIL